MKYIQCQHCEKKYTASEKLCAAAGKKIRCKHCQQVFEIIIHDEDHEHIAQESRGQPPADINTEAAEGHEAPAASDAASPDESAEQEVPAESNNKPEKDAGSEKKKINVHLYISIILGLTLLTTATVAYLYFYQHTLFEPSEKQAEKTIIPHQMIKPVSISFSDQKPAASEKPKPDSNKQQTESTQAQDEQPTLEPQKAKALLDGPDKPSQVCKDSAADYWFRTRLLVTVQLDTATYLELLNQNLEQAEEMRRLCKDKRLIIRITEAAKTGQIPPWIKTEIQSRNETVAAPAETPQSNSNG